MAPTGAEDRLKPELSNTAMLDKKAFVVQFRLSAAILGRICD
jgi:hypothetical protein